MRHLKQIILIVSFVLLIPMVFQNCAEPLEVSSEDQASANANLAFAYEAKIDTISYMSCSNIDIASFQPRAIYSFRAGAYGKNAGIRLSKEFLKETEHFSDEERATALFESSLNQNTSLQLALRKRQSYQEVLINSEGVVRDGFDIANFLQPLDTSGLATRLSITPEGEYVNYFGGTPGLGNRIVEQSIRFIESEEKAEQVRNHLMGIGVNRPSMLSLTYTAGSDGEPYYAKYPEGEDGKASVFGTSFEINFRQALGYNSGPRRGLALIEEFDALSGQKTDGVWNCGQDAFSFVVVRPGDTGIRTCNTVVDPQASTLSELEKKRLELIRRVLPVEDWYVDVKNQCVVRKNNAATCYGEANGAVTINYTSACKDNCPHIVSVCERQN